MIYLLVFLLNGHIYADDICNPYLIALLKMNESTNSPSDVDSLTELIWKVSKGPRPSEIDKAVHTVMQYRYLQQRFPKFYELIKEDDEKKVETMKKYMEQDEKYQALRTKNFLE